MKKTMTALSVIVALLLITVAACSGSDDDASAPTTGAATTTMAMEDGPQTTMDSDDGAPVPAGEEGAERDQAADDGSGIGTDSNAVVTTVDPADFGRSIVFTANLEVEVEDIVTAGEQAESVVAGLGGFLFGQETQTGENPRSVLTIKVLPENFGEALRRLAGIGELISQSVFADDVTDRVVDLESQITTAEASVERLREFLEDATDVEDLATLEAELLRRETELERLRGQLRTLEDQVALATIVLALTEPAPPAPEPILELLQTGYAGHDGGQSCPGIDRLTVDEGDAATLCYELTNTGNVPLVEIEVREPFLDADSDDIIVVQGDLSAPLLPDERLILALEITADPDGFLSPDVTARAVDEDEEPLRIGVQIEDDILELEVIEDTSLPGFVDALGAAWDGLQRFFGVIVVVAGALVPFLWVPLLAAGWWLWRRRDRQRTQAEAAAYPEPPPEDQAEES